MKRPLYTVRKKASKSKILYGRRRNSGGVSLTRQSLFSSGVCVKILYIDSGIISAGRGEDRNRSE